LPYNPWLYSNQNSLVDGFFRELSIAIGKTGAKEKEATAKNLLLYGKLSSTGSNIVKYLKEFIPVPLLGTALEKALSTLGQEFKDYSELLQAELEANDKTLEELKEQLSGNLRALPKPILVIIDDVDRLTVEETRLLFQLIKANADFPKLIYLVLFQRDIVEKSLTINDQIEGKDFLEKIIQVGFHIPKIDKDGLKNFVNQEIRGILEQRGINHYFDFECWNQLYDKGLNTYFRNIRATYRLLNSYNFHLGVFNPDSGACDINPQDLLILEIFRVFNEKLYNKIYSMKKFISASPNEDFRGGYGKILQEVMPPGGAANSSKEVHLELKSLEEYNAFQVGFKYLFNNASGEPPSDSYQRLQNPRYFDQYFNFSL